LHPSSPPTHPRMRHKSPISPKIPTPIATNLQVKAASDRFGQNRDPSQVTLSLVIDQRIRRRQDHGRRAAIRQARGQVFLRDGKAAFG